ncbi:SH3 domain-containing protein [Bacillus sp. JJ722]|uniref:SH3 domain-containing protein n=1 Tax=Bacillus sp. JJ722 TaxID=3122973 RepID=UPI002FFDBE36
MNNGRFLKILVVAALAISLFIPLSNIEASAASTQIGTIDITSGKLNVRSAPSKNAKVIGSLKRSDKVKSLGQSKTGWTTIQYGKGKGYISSDHVRFYKTTSLGSVKKITEGVIATQKKARYPNPPQTRAQIHKKLAPSFTKEYIDLFIKWDLKTYGKDKYGNTLYGTPYSDNLSFTLFPFDWYLRSLPEKPTVIFYHKKGVEYMEVSQNDPTLGLYDPHWTKWWLKKESKSTWKVYKFDRIYD